MDVIVHHRSKAKATELADAKAAKLGKPAPAPVKRRKLRQPPIAERMPAVVSPAAPTDPPDVPADPPADPPDPAPSSPTPVVSGTSGASSGSSGSTSGSATSGSSASSGSSGSSPGGSTGVSSSTSTSIVPIGAPPVVEVPSVPAGFVPVNPADLKGFRPLQTELAVAPDAVLELQGFANYAAVFGALAPDPVNLAQLLTVASQWTGLLNDSTDWLTYVKSEEGIAWKDALVQLNALKVPFQLASTANPAMISQYPSLARLLGASQVVAKRAVSTKAKAKKATATANAAAAAAAASAASSGSGSSTTPAAASVTPAAGSGSGSSTGGPTVTVQA